MIRLALLLFTPLAAAFAAERPNIVLINVDDLGYADTGPYGSTNPTPHLDRMAREGRKLTSHYAAPVCSPSRASLLTGCYPKRVLPIPHVLFPGAAVGLHPAERTIAEVLKDAGYATGCFGKWHVGDQLEFLPTRQGFDTYYGIPYSNDMGPAVDGAKSNPDRPLPTAAEIAAKASKAKSQGVDEVGIRGNQPPLPLLENETVIERVRRPEQHTLATRFTDQAVAFIRAQRARPFFVYLPYAAVHFPHHPRADFAGKSPNGALGDWAVEIDLHVGRVLDTLRELGLEKKTLVIFTSDNGGPTAQGAKNTPLRGSKGQTLEGGIRTCTIAWWPGRIPGNSATSAITSMMDFLPTFAGLAGARLAPDRKLDGADLTPLLVAARPETVPAPHDTFHYFRGLTLEAVRSGPWKLHLGSGELYHLERDIGEKASVAAANPEVVARLRGLARAMDSDLGVEGTGPGVRALGRVASPAPILSANGTVRGDLKNAGARFP